MGFPTLGHKSVGLGHQAKGSTHYFEAMEVHLTRGELAQRAQAMRKIARQAAKELQEAVLKEKQLAAAASSNTNVSSSKKRA